MRVGFALIFFLPFLLIARDNPFLPVITPQESGKVAEVPQPDFFMSEEIYLPSSARKLLKVDITYLNMDGSMETVQTELEKDIDWHFPIIVAQEKSSGNTASPPKPEKKATQSTAPTKTATDPKTQEIVQHKVFKPLNWISIEIKNKQLTIHTENKLLRHFALSEPIKLVLDFQRDSNFYSKSIPTESAYYKHINIGNHKDFYRIAIELDGQYRYDLEESKDTYVITLQ